MSNSLHFDSSSNILELNGVPVSLHCHHYNCGLLKSIEEIANIDGHAVIVEIAAQEFSEKFKQFLEQETEVLSPDKALQEASELYRLMGFGRLDLSNLTARGGVAYSDSSYFSVSWLAKYGRRNTPVCYFTCGFIAGILAAIYNVPPDTYEVNETECIILRHDQCKFIVSEKSDGN